MVGQDGRPPDEDQRNVCVEGTDESSRQQANPGEPGGTRRHHEQVEDPKRLKRRDLGPPDERGRQCDRNDDGQSHDDVRQQRPRHDPSCHDDVHREEAEPQHDGQREDRPHPLRRRVVFLPLEQLVATGEHGRLASHAFPPSSFGRLVRLAGHGARIPCYIHAMRLHLVDGTYELFRAHYSPRPGHTDPEGRDRKATVGVVGSLLSLIDDVEEEVTHVAVAFDNPILSFRNELFDGYKTGEGIEPDLRSQFDPVEEAVRALGVAVWSMDRWEADDAMASGAAQFADQVEQVRLMTPDKDLGQCVRGTHVVQIDRMRGKFIDEDRLRELRGFGPQSVPDWLALVGDSADGIPGLPGFGAKSASTLLGHYEHVEAIPDLPGQWEVTVRGAKRLAATLAEHRDDVALYKKLATLVTDVPLGGGLDDLQYKGTPRESWTRWCEEVGRTEWVDRPKRWLD